MRLVLLQFSPSHVAASGKRILLTTLGSYRQFYALSLAHHPDKNPEDPQAHHKFASISSAYQVLSSATKRARYDRDHGIHQAAAATASPGLHSTAHRGSYVGSRPPSGLSKRRGQFRGPPPSFYAHGGYGNTSNGQGQHKHHPHHAHPHNHHPHKSASSSWPFSNSSAGRRSSATDDPTSFVYSNTVHHFDASAHFRTQSAEDARRRIRRAKAVEYAKEQARARGIDLEEDVGSASARFFAVMGIVAVALLCFNIGRSIEPMPATMRKPGTRPPRPSEEQHHKEG